MVLTATLLSRKIGGSLIRCYRPAAVANICIKTRFTLTNYFSTNGLNFVRKMYMGKEPIYHEPVIMN